MGKKLSDLGFTAGRKDVETILPTELSLVWHKRTPEMGPNDFVVCPDLEWAFDPTIDRPIDPAHVETALTKQDGKYIGIMQPIGYRKVEYKGKLRLFVVFGRGRTRIAREANKRIHNQADYIFVPSIIQNVDDVGAALRRDVENLHRKTLNPIDIARIAEYHTDKGTPEPMLLRAVGVKSMAQVKNYLALLKKPQALQKQVADRELSMSAALKLSGPVEGKKTVRELEGKTKMMSRGAIEKWERTAEGDVKATLRQVLGLAVMGAITGISLLALAMEWV